MRDYAAAKGLRVMGFHVIRYKTCDEAVGCKIYVPDAQQNQAPEPQICGHVTSPAGDGSVQICGRRHSEENRRGDLKRDCVRRQTDTIQSCTKETWMMEVGIGIRI